MAGGVLLARTSIPFIFSITCIALLGAFVVIMIVPTVHIDPKVDIDRLPSLHRLLRVLYATITEVSRLKLALYMLIFSTIPDTDPQPLFYYYTNHLGMDTQEMTIYTTWQQGIAMALILLYGAMLGKYPVRV